MKKNGRLGMRVDPADKEKWEATAIRHGMSLSEWMTTVLNTRANEEKLIQLGYPQSDGTKSVSPR